MFILLTISSMYMFSQIYSCKWFEFILIFFTM